MLINRTHVNKYFNQSHTIFKISLIQKINNVKDYLTSELILADLAGSENITKTKTSTENYLENKDIKKSLFSLESVMNALAKQNPHTPFRNNILTRCLQNGLYNDKRTNFIICLSPLFRDYSETKESIYFSQQIRGKSKNKMLQIFKCIPWRNVKNSPEISSSVSTQIENQLEIENQQEIETQLEIENQLKTDNNLKTNNDLKTDNSTQSNDSIQTDNSSKTDNLTQIDNSTQIDKSTQIDPFFQTDDDEISIFLDDYNVSSLSVSYENNQEYFSNQETQINFDKELIEQWKCKYDLIKKKSDKIYRIFEELKVNNSNKNCRLNHFYNLLEHQNKQMAFLKYEIERQKQMQSIGFNVEKMKTKQMFMNLYEEILEKVLIIADELDHSIEKPDNLRCFNFATKSSDGIIIYLERIRAKMEYWKRFHQNIHEITENYNPDVYHKKLITERDYYQKNNWKTQMKLHKYEERIIELEYENEDYLKKIQSLANYKTDLEEAMKNIILSDRKLLQAGLIYDNVKSSLQQTVLVKEENKEEILNKIYVILSDYKKDSPDDILDKKYDQIIKEAETAFQEYEAENF